MIVRRHLRADERQRPRQPAVCGRLAEPPGSIPTAVSG